MSLCRPNRATASRTQLTVQEESCWGQLATGQDAKGIEFANEGLNNQISFFDSTLIRADRMRSASSRGKESPGGDISGELQPNGIWPLLIRHALGGSVTTTGSGPYKHVMAGALLLPEGLSIEKRFGYPDGTYDRLRYLGGKVNEFGLTLPTNGVVTCKASMLFKSETEVGSDMDATPTFSTDNAPFTSYHGQILLDSDGSGSLVQVATVQSLDFTINNGIDPAQFAIDGTYGRADLAEDERTIKGNLTAFFTDQTWALYQATKNDTTLKLDLRFTRGSKIFRFYFPSFKARFPTPTVAGKGPLNIGGPLEIFRDDVLGTDIVVELTNDDPVISTAA